MFSAESAAKARVNFLLAVGVGGVISEGGS